MMETTKKENPNMDNYLLWLCAVDYVLEEKGLKKEMKTGLKCIKNMLKKVVYFYIIPLK